MGLIQFAIKNPVKVAVGVILLALFGALSIFEIPIQLTPDVDKPIITVTTRWTGASPQEIESEIVDRQEDKLKSVTNLKKMTSTSQEGQATIRLEFPVDIDKDIAFRDVSDKLRQVTDYPEEVDEPVVTATDDDMSNTIAWLILAADDGSDVSRIKTFVEDQVKPQLERAEGISEVSVYGGRDREIQVEIDPHLLAARKLTLRDVESALRRQNVNVSAGTIVQGKRDYTYRTLGEYRNVDEVAQTVIDYRDGGPILVKDVGRVIDGFKRQYAFVRSKGRFVIAMPARRETGANVIKAMESLKERIAVVNRDILAARGLGIELTQVYDETTYIWSAIGLVVKNILFGGALAVIVLMLFLRSASATGIIAVAIPICVIGSFLTVNLVGRSLNVVMLAGMAFAVGMVVDNAIVVLENIYRHRSMGKSKSQAALDGAREVWGAVLASTLTTMAVFLPVITIKEEAGQLFKDIAIAISSAVGLSLIVSIIVIPPMASRMFTGGKALATGDKPWWLAERLSSIVAAINRRRGRRLAVVGGFTFAALLGSWLLVPATEYLPAGNRNLVFGFLITPPGYSVDEYKRMATIVEEGDPNNPMDGIRKAWQVELGSKEAAMLPPVNIPVGQDNGEVQTVVPPPIDNFFFVSFGGGAFMGATSKDETNVKPVEYMLTRAAGRIAGTMSFFSQASLFRSGRSSGNSVDVEIRSDDNEAVVGAAQAITRKVMEAGYDYPRPTPQNFALGRPEVQIVPDRAKAADLGLDVRDVGFVLESCIDGAFIGEFNDRGDKIDMALKIEGTEKATVDEISRIPIYTPTGHVVPIESAVQIIRTTAPQQIDHIEEMNAVTLAVKPKPGMPLQAMMQDLTDNVIGPLRKEGAIPENVYTALAGTADKLTQTQQALVGQFAGSIVRPRLLGMSVGTTMAVLLLTILILGVVLRIVLGARPALITTGWLLLVAAIGFLVANPELLAAVARSRACLALLITYLLMAALFESFIYPFVIMFSVPLAAVGGFLALRIVHEVSLHDVTSPIQQLDVLTMLGFVILVGIVVNNAILIVHQALNFMREQDMPPAEAVVHSVRTRTRPIFMSALTSIFGMAPLVVMPGAGSELYRGLGSVVLGGLLLSTVFTLLVIPAMFTILLDLRQRIVEAIGSASTDAVPVRKQPAPAVAPAHSMPRSPDAL